MRAPALQGELIWDDTFLARDNPFIKSPLLAVEAFRHHLLLESLSLHYRPVQNLSYMPDYFFWHTNTWGFHFSNVLWHVGSGLLLYFLLRRLLPTLWRRDVEHHVRNASLPALLLSLLWVVHPVHSAAVDYISGRADSLAFFFGSGAWLLFLRARGIANAPLRTAAFVLSALSFLLALCSRESACMWAVVFVLHLILFDRSYTVRAKVAVVAAVLAVGMVYGGLRHLPERRSVAAPTHGWSSPTRAVLMLRALGDYGRLIVFPARLHMERTVVNESLKTNADWRRTIATEYLTIFGLLVAAGLIWGAMRRGAAQHLRIFGASWFIVAYLPISNVVDLNATVAEHWLYLPSVGLLLFVAGVCLELPRRAFIAATVCAVVAVTGLSVRSYYRSSDWVTNETFYRRTIESGGGSVRVVLNLGMIYSGRGDHVRAERLFRKALEMSPTYVMARNNLAASLQAQGKMEEAEQTYREASAAASEARKEFPRTWAAALNLAKLRVDEENYPAALDVLTRACADYPNVWRLISLRAELLRRSDNPDAALALIEEFVGDYWWHAEASVALGRLYWEKGDLARSEETLRHASRLDVHDANSLNLIAALNMHRSRFPEALRAQRRALARQPDEPRQYVLLSSILEKMGQSDEARRLLAQVTRMETLARQQSAPN